MTFIRYFLPNTHARILSAQNVLWAMAVADTFAGLVQDYFPVSMVLRGALCLYLMMYVVFLAKSTVSSRLLWVLVMAYFVARVLVDYLILQDEKALSMEVSSSLRLLYFPLLYVFLSDQIERGMLGAENVRDALLTYGWLVLASLFIGEVTGLGSAIGGRGTAVEGGKGFMIGANEVGLLLLLTAPFVARYCLRATKNILIASVLVLGLYLAGGMYVFTKSSLIASVVAVFAVYRMCIERSASARRSARTVALMAVLFGIYLILQNLHAIEVFANGTFFAALLNEGIIAFLFRGRNDYAEAIIPQLLEHTFNGIILLFGAGEYYVRGLSLRPLFLSPGEGSLFEMDFFDLLAAYGVAGLCAYAMVLRPLYLRACQTRFPPEVFLALLGTMAHSFMAGHVIFSPQVTTLVVLILLFYRPVAAASSCEVQAASTQP